MALAKVTYTTDGVQRTFPITFPYIDLTNIVVTKGTATLAYTTDYTISGGSVIFVAAPTGGQTLVIKRATKSDAKVLTFHDASVLTAPDLEAANTQLFYLIQESLDNSSVVSSMANAADVAVAAAAQAQAAAAAAAINHSGEFYADNTGTPDAIAVAYPTAPSTLTDGYRLTVGIISPNVTATPVITVSLGGVSQPSRSLVKANGSGWATLVAGDLQGNADIRYDLPNARWILMNPAKPVTFAATGATDPVPLSQVQALDTAVMALITGNTVYSPYTAFPAANTAMTYTHGLGFIPADASLEMICIVADNGYAVGDILSTPLAQGAPSYLVPFPVVRNITTVYSRMGNYLSLFHNSNTTGGTLALTITSWNYRFKIRKY